MAKFIILKVRKFKFLGWIYLFFFSTIMILGLSNNPQQPIAQNPNNLPSGSQYTQSGVNQYNPPAPVANSAKAKAFKSGSEITIRWDKPVFDQSFKADNRRVSTDSISCQLDFCTLNISDPINILKARWTENGERFSKNFRLN